MVKHIEKKEEILLSIIVPVYNGEKYLATLLDSIISNNGEDFAYEIILINDGSTDHSETVCRLFEQNTSNIHYYLKSNGGIASARNEGVNRAKGKYITFADQDDKVISSYKKHVEKCVNEQIEMYITSYCICQNEKVTDAYTLSDEVIDDRRIIKDIAATLIDSKYFKAEKHQNGPNSVWNIIYSRSLIVENNIYFKSFIDYEDDWIFNIETLLHANKIAMSCKKYYCWNIHKTSESHRGKYIYDLINKRKSWMEWLMSILQLLDINKKTIDLFISHVLIPRNIMISFKNTCWKPEVSSKDIIDEIRIILSTEGWDIDTVDISKIDEMPNIEKLLFILLKQRRLRMAYFLNRYIFGRRFH